MNKTDLFKLAILNELIGDELHKIPVERLLDNNLHCKVKNARKSANSLTNYFDELFGFKSAEVFGDFCEQIIQVVDDAIKTIEND